MLCLDAAQHSNIVLCIFALAETGTSACEHATSLLMAADVFGTCRLQEICAWLHDNQIVQRLLRTGLHHKQYMNEVSSSLLQHYTSACD